MLKLALKRALMGTPIGMAMSYVITVIISLAMGDGLYHPVVPALADQWGSEINAVVFQFILSGLQGAAIGAVTIIWSMEKWSLAKQTGIYLILLSAIILPVAYFAHWMPRTTFGFILYIAIFVSIFITICVANYAIWRGKIKKMNKRVPSSRI